MPWEVVTLPFDRKARDAIGRDRGDDEFPAPSEACAYALHIVIEQAPPFDAQLRLERARPIVEPRVDDFAVATRRAGARMRSGLENEDFVEDLVGDFVGDFV